jgi:hypothetical protein
MVCDGPVFGSIPSDPNYNRQQNFPTQRPCAENERNFSGKYHRQWGSLAVDEDQHVPTLNPTRGAMYDRGEDAERMHLMLKAQVRPDQGLPSYRKRPHYSNQVAEVYQPAGFDVSNLELHYGIDSHLITEPYCGVPQASALEKSLLLPTNKKEFSRGLERAAASKMKSGAQVPQGIFSDAHMYDGYGIEKALNPAYEDSDGYDSDDAQIDHDNSDFSDVADDDDGDGGGGDAHKGNTKNKVNKRDKVYSFEDPAISDEDIKEYRAEYKHKIDHLVYVEAGKKLIDNILDKIRFEEDRTKQQKQDDVRMIGEEWERWERSKEVQQVLMDEVNSDLTGPISNFRSEAINQFDGKQTARVQQKHKNKIESYFASILREYAKQGMSKREHAALREKHKGLMKDVDEALHLTGMTDDPKSLFADDAETKMHKETQAVEALKQFKERQMADADASELKPSLEQVFAQHRENTEKDKEKAFKQTQNKNETMGDESKERQLANEKQEGKHDEAMGSHKLSEKVKIALGVALGGENSLSIPHTVDMLENVAMKETNNDQVSADKVVMEQMLRSVEATNRLRGDLARTDIKDKFKSIFQTKTRDRGTEAIERRRQDRDRSLKERRSNNGAPDVPDVTMKNKEYKAPNERREERGKGGANKHIAERGRAERSQNTITQRNQNRADQIAARRAN